MKIGDYKIYKKGLGAEYVVKNIFTKETISNFCNYAEAIDFCYKMNGKNNSAKKTKSIIKSKLLKNSELFKKRLNSCDLK